MIVRSCFAHGTARRAARCAGLHLQQRRHSSGGFVFSPENFRSPNLGAHGPLRVLDVPVLDVRSNADLAGYGYLVEDPSQFTCEKNTFEIAKWPVQSWRQLDPHTGDEAGTTEGDFEVAWHGDYYYGRNLAINTVNNVYLDGMGTHDPQRATHDEPGAGCGEAESYYGDAIYLWMSDYHPDGGQLFFPRPDEGAEFSFTMCLGLSSHGDDIRPEDMRGFRIPPGKGAYIHPGTWHNGFYIHRRHSPKTCFTRQGRVHARVSCSWAAEFQTMLRLRLA